MRLNIRKWGNSAGIRIPAAIMEAAKVELDMQVNIREEAGNIIIEPIRDATYDLETLLEGITDDNRHKPVDFGDPRGKEAL